MNEITPTSVWTSTRAKKNGIRYILHGLFWRHDNNYPWRIVDILAINNSWRNIGITTTIFINYISKHIGFILFQIVD